MSDEEKEEYEELKSLLYTGTISQYGKRKLIDIVEKQQKEIEELKKNNGYHLGFIDGGIAKKYEMEDKIKAKIEELKIYATVLTEPERQILRFNIEKFEYGIELLQSLLKEE